MIRHRRVGRIFIGFIMLCSGVILLLLAEFFPR